MALKDKATLSTEKDTLFAENTSGDITPADLRNQTQDDIDSFLNLDASTPEQTVAGDVDFVGVIKQNGVAGAFSPAPTGKRYGDMIQADGAGAAVYQQKVWEDLRGHIVARDSGATAPSYSVFRGGSFRAYSFAVNDEIEFNFHLPHNYALGTDIFIHAHWSHNGTAISGNMQWDYTATYAKGHDQEIFPAEVSGTIIYNTVDIATTPRYIHRIDEVQISTSGGSASQVDTDDLEPDGLMLVNVTAAAIPSISGGSPNEPFLLEIDIHYQADIQGTKNKVPNFYT